MKKREPSSNRIQSAPASELVEKLKADNALLRKKLLDSNPVAKPESMKIITGFAQRSDRQ